MIEVLYSHAADFLKLILLGVLSLFPPVNPFGTALMLDPLFGDMNVVGRRAAALRIAIYCFFICVGALLMGTYLLKFFGVTIPVVKLAGGILICRMGWNRLSATHETGVTDEDTEAGKKISRSHRKLSDLLFYPIAFPSTTGAGTISVVLTLSAKMHSTDVTIYVFNLSALLISILIIATLIYMSYAYTHTVLRKLGPQGNQILTRLSAFLVFCVGLQIAVEGLSTIVRDFK